MQRFEDYVEKSQQVGTVPELARQYGAAVAEHGYENSVLTSLRGRNFAHVAWVEFPDGYADTYLNRRWERVDPVLGWSLRAPRPFFWNDVSGRVELSSPQLTFMESCKDFKVHSGVTFPFHGPGHRLDIMSISRRIPDAPDVSRCSLLHALSVQTWSRYLELTNDEPLLPQEGAALTPRELEILRWCKDGKSRPDIGDILSISHKTVEFHLANIMNKLGASNQITAVVIAIQRGLIEL